MRAWIDQGAKWSQKAIETRHVLVSPTIRWIGVSGDKRQFREQMWTRDGWVGGLQEFRLEERSKPGEKFTAQGSVLGMPREYRLRLDYERLIWVRPRRFRAISALLRRHRRILRAVSDESFNLGRDLAVDVGRAWIEFGLTLPHWPRMVLGYEYQFKEGNKIIIELERCGFWPRRHEPGESGDFPGL